MADWGRSRLSRMEAGLGYRVATKYPYSVHRTPAGPGSRSSLRREYLQGILYSRRDMKAGGKGLIPFDRGAAWFAGSRRAITSARRRDQSARGYRSPSNLFGPRRTLPTASRARSGRNVGSFRHRKGSWAKGKGGRFVGTA